MEKLLKPWLGDDFSIDRLPVPVLLEVNTRVQENASTVNLPALRKALEAIDSGIRVAERGPWVNQFAAALGMLQSLVLMIAGLLILCVIGMVVLVARTNLKLHFKTVGLLHMFGATDDYILGQFQWESAWLAARGAFMGVIIAAIVFAGAIAFTTQLHSPLIPVLRFSLEHAMTLLLLPVFTALVAYLATRVTVRAMLHQMH
jgi:cell division protein FtsX